MRTAVRTHRVLHRLVFLYRRFGQLLPECQNLPQRLLRIFHQLRYSLFIKGIRFHPILRKPLFHLLNGIWVLQSCQFLHCRRQFRLGTPVYGNRIPDHLHIHTDAPVIYLLVLPVFLPHKIRHRVSGKPLLYLHLRLHITQVIGFEPLPLLPVMPRQVPRPAAVCLGRLARDTEIPDQVFPLRQLLLLQPKHRAYILQ